MDRLRWLLRQLGGTADSGLVLVTWAFDADVHGELEDPLGVLALPHSEGNRFDLPTGGRTATLTTSSTGAAQRRLRITFRGFPDLPHIDTVEVTVTAKNFKGIPLAGSPLVYRVINPK